jgi:hypothetical protein
MKRTSPYLPLLAIALLACGGSAKQESGNPGTKHSPGTGDSDVDIDTPVSSTLPDADAGTAAVEPSAAVTFVLKNTGKESLFINMDKGFGAVIRAYSGKPPNAKPILMFPTHCTASCEAAPEDICPVCEEPKRAKDIKAAEKHDEVTPGDSRRVEWDTMAFAYKKSPKGKGKRCRCHESVEPPPEEYTVQACGLRKTQSAKKPSKYQCVTSTLTLPVTEPVVVELDFGK